jgi:hypothetical protein
LEAVACIRGAWRLMELPEWRAVLTE